MRALAVRHTHPRKRSRFWRRLGLSIILISLVIGSLLLLNQNRLSTAWYSSRHGLVKLEQGTSNLLAKPRLARDAFRSASRDFDAAVSSLKKMDRATKSLFLLPAARDSLFIMNVGEEAAGVGESLTKLLSSAPPKLTSDFVTTIDQTMKWLAAWTKQNRGELNDLGIHLDRLNQAVKEVNAAFLPAAYRGSFNQWQSTLPRLADNYGTVREILNQTNDLTGQNGARRYMIIFQNNTELRPTGGFIGSYASLELNGSQPANFWFMTNIWHADPQGNWTPIAAPYPLSDFVPIQEVFDANWDPDFPRSAQLLLRFYQAIHGQSAQGVIAIDTSLLTDLLEITGPIPFPQYNTTLDADNFLETVQYKVEKEYFDNVANKKENQPKKILADFIPVLFARLSKLSPAEQQKLAELIGRAAARRTIQIYSDNKTVETQLVKLGLAGELKSTTSDYIHLNNANIGGGKSSLNIKQAVTLNQRVIGSTIENTLTITRTHTGNGQWPDKDNNNYLRLYVPLGSNLTKTDGSLETVKVTEENGRTVIGGWFRTPVAEKHVASIVYTLPPAISVKDYSLLWQRQSGENPTAVMVDSSLLGQRSFDLETDQTLTQK